MHRERAAPGARARLRLPDLLYPPLSEERYSLTPSSSSSSSQGITSGGCVNGHARSRLRVLNENKNPPSIPIFPFAPHRP